MRSSNAAAMQSGVVYVPQAALLRRLATVWDSRTCSLIGGDELSSAHVVAAAVTWNGPEDAQVLHRVSTQLPHVPLMAVMARVDPLQCAAVLRAGAVSIVSTRMPDAQLAMRLLRLTAQEATLPAGAVRMMTQQWREAEQLRDTLGTKALELLQMIADGLTIAEVARRTHSTERTVYRHLRQVMAALDVDSREAALVRAARLGLLGNPGGSCLAG